jgi:hypothetical protein
MIEQILPNNNERCYSNFSPTFREVNTPLTRFHHACAECSAGADERTDDDYETTTTSQAYQPPTDPADAEHRPSALITSHPNPKYFLFHPSHQIFRRMYEALNVGKKDN